MSKTVYVGRIPFDYTEEQVGDIFRSAGPVQEVRLVFEKGTGKSKGFAFIEFYDAESAASAVRNLDNYQVGHMKLKVDFSNDSGKGQNGAGASSAAEHIASVINDESREKKDEFLRDLKQYISSDRYAAMALLESAPQLAYAVVQTMIDMGRIDQRTADTLLPSAGVAEPEPEKASSGRNKGRKSQKLASAPPTEKRSRSGTPVAAQKNETQPAKPTTPEAPAVANKPTGRVIDAQEKTMIMQVMGFTDEQLNLLPVEQQKAIRDIRAKVASGEIIV